MKRTGIARGKPLARGASTLKRERVKASNPARKASEFSRAYGSAERAAAIKRLPCLVENESCAGWIENAHVPSKSGAGRKGDACHNVSLCAWHHRLCPITSLHALGKTKFNAMHHIDLDAEAAKVERMFPTTHEE